VPARETLGRARSPAPPPLSSFDREQTMYVVLALMSACRDRLPMRKIRVGTVAELRHDALQQLDPVGRRAMGRQRSGKPCRCSSTMESGLG
jgi:hypothetical protein